MKKFLTFIFINILLGSITIPVIHAHCMDTMDRDGTFLCCYETDDGNSCNKHTPVDTSNDEVLNNTFTSKEKIQKFSTKILLDISGGSDKKQVGRLSLGGKHLFEKNIPPILSQKLRAYTKEIKKRE